jgi:bifunctional non-homologous end joining protein LigD
MPDSVMKKKVGGKRLEGRGKALKKAAAKTAKRKASSTLPPPTSPLPLFLSPQLATLVDEPPDGDEWIYEVKFDGYRVVARIDGGDVKLFTRNGNDWTKRLGTLAEAIGRLPVDKAWIDGEIVVPGAKGIPSFQLLQGAFDNARTKDIVFFAFDLPWAQGRDLTRLPLVERRELLEKLFQEEVPERVRFSAHFEGPVAPLLEGACKQGLEGLIGKRRNAPYTSTRSTAWVKIKCTKRQEFVIVGHTDPKGSRTGFGSLLLALHDEGSGELRYAGNVGTGFDEKLLSSIKSRLDSLATEKPAFKVPKGVKGHWVRPNLVAEVAFTEWTGDGRVRHPVFQGLRADKKPETVTRERANNDFRATGLKKAERAKGVNVSHGERVIDPSTQLTKLDLVTYYDRIAEWILPHLAGRPATLVRAPAGIEGTRFSRSTPTRCRSRACASSSARSGPATTR